MSESELLICILASVVLMVVWFKFVLLLGKFAVGKDADLWKIIVFLIIAGPIGWAVILIIFVYNQVDKHWAKIFK
jgi:hypothetical protein